MKNLRSWQDSFGRFKKGVPSWTKGKHPSKETKEKMRQAKLKNPVRYWLGKERKNLGGKIITRKDGYQYIAYSLVEKWIRKCFKDYGTRPIPYHKYIWIKNTKKPIPKGLQVHHINGKKDDNRIENLRTVDALTHRRIHIGCELRGSKWWKPCLCCGELKELETNYSYKSEGRINSWCKSCCDKKSLKG
jgi:hypothetical protein